jgi:hypothetical protein
MKCKALPVLAQMSDSIECYDAITFYGDTTDKNRFWNVERRTFHALWGTVT